MVPGRSTMTSGHHHVHIPPLHAASSSPLALPVAGRSRRPTASSRPSGSTGRSSSPSPGSTRSPPRACAPTSSAPGSPAGLDVGARFGMSRKISLGAAFTWNGMTQSGDPKKSLQSLALRGMAHWYFTNSEIQPYVGLFAGGAYMEVLQGAGPTQTGFAPCAGPELGFLFTVADGLALIAGGPVPVNFAEHRRERRPGAAGAAVSVLGGDPGWASPSTEPLRSREGPAAWKRGPRESWGLPRSSSRACLPTRARSRRPSSSTTPTASSTTRTSIGRSPSCREALDTGTTRTGRSPSRPSRSIAPWRGRTPSFHRGVNVAIHIANSLLVLALVLAAFQAPRLRGSVLAPSAWAVGLAAGLLFVTHPIQTQAVSYIVQRLASLAALLYLATVTLYVRWRTARESGQRRRRPLGDLRIRTLPGAPRHQDEGGGPHAAPRAPARGGRPLRRVVEAPPPRPRCPSRPRSP